MLKSRNSLSGFSVIETLIACGFVGAMVYGVTYYATTAAKIQSSSSTRLDLTQLSYAVLNGMNCKATLSGVNLAASCQTGAFTYKTGYQTGPYLSLKRTDNQPLFTNDSMGDWYLRTVCVRGTTNSLVVYASKRTSANATSAMKDAMFSNESYDWAPIFFEGISLCRNEVINGVAASTTPVYWTGPGPAAVNLSSVGTWVNRDYGARICNGNTYFPEYFALFNHGSGSFYQATFSGCPAGYIPTASHYSIGGANAVPWMWVPSRLSRSADGRTLISEIGAAFGNAQNSLFTASLFSACVRVQ